MSCFDRIGAVIPAAGAGARLGGVAKALLPFGDHSFLSAIAAVLRATGSLAHDLIVVVGPPHGEAVAAAARELGLTVAVNPAPERGMASSIAIGFAMLERSGVTAAFLWPVDHPAVDRATIETLIEHEGGVPEYAGRGGHPALVPCALFAALAACGDHPDGARGVLRGALPRIAIADRGVIADVDLPEDLACAR